ncbi:oligonucleotide/oligosaccharide-binding fold domain-containing protein [Micromonospora sp. M12]
MHQSLLPGLLSHIGLKDAQKHEYLGARGAKFALFPGSALFKKPPRWVMAAELVETSRLWAASPAGSSRSGSSRSRNTWSSAATASRTGRRSRPR